MSAVPDFVYPDTSGERPPQLAYMLRMNAALRQLAAEDEYVHKINEEVSNLIAPSTALTEGSLGRRVLLKMASTRGS